ncbi:MAG: ABC transporter permease [Saprospiraceae bacterium]|nr:ABC transporter permease [Saprospiraceae bacterium]MBP7679914.1 ABC transporter permease [Saprospiraceae bacterium]
MNIAFRIAQRYLWGKKSTNTINIISGISVLGIAIGTAALVLVLSVFNGFEELLGNLTSAFNPDIKITPTKGKTFDADTLLLQKIARLPEVASISSTLEEVAFFEYEGSQDFGILKGIDDHYAKVTGIDATLREGSFRLREGDRNLGIVGAGMRNKLSIDIDAPFQVLNVYIPKREGASALEPPFKKRFLYPTGTFATQQDFDSEYILAPLALVQELLNLPNGVSALEIKLKNAAYTSAVVKSIRQTLGTHFIVKDKYQQNEAFMKIMNIEKWISYAILSLTLLLVAFNMIGALWMVILDKKQDITILKSMGANSQLIRNIFLYEGLFYCAIGIGIGYMLAILLYILQKQYGLVSIPEGFAINAYPVNLRLIDFVIVAATVLLIGLSATLLPARFAANIDMVLKTDA